MNLRLEDWLAALVHDLAGARPSTRWTFGEDLERPSVWRPTVEG